MNVTWNEKRLLPLQLTWLEKLEYSQFLDKFFAEDFVFSKWIFKVSENNWNMGVNYNKHLERFSHFLTFPGKFVPRNQNLHEIWYLGWLKYPEFDSDANFLSEVLARKYPLLLIVIQIFKIFCYIVIHSTWTNFNMQNLQVTSSFSVVSNFCLSCLI